MRYIACGLSELRHFVGVYWFGAGIHPDLCKTYGVKENQLIFRLNSSKDFF